MTTPVAPLAGPSGHQLLADAVLLLHAGVVLFVVIGLPAIVLGNRRGWRWVNRPAWRGAHLAAIALVALQAWLGQACVLTELESAWRRQAGQAGYRRSFVEHWVQAILYHEAPSWVFTVAYSVFAAAVAWAWWRYPPRAAEGRGPSA